MELKITWLTWLALRRTAAYVRGTGVSIWAIDEEEEVPGADASYRPRSETNTVFHFMTSLISADPQLCYTVKYTLDSTYQTEVLKKQKSKTEKTASVQEKSEHTRG